MRKTLKTKMSWARGFMIVLIVVGWSAVTDVMSAPKANLDQIRNGTATAPVSPPNWVNGNAGASQAHYNEGHSIAYRMVITGLPIGSHFVDIEWDIRQGSKSAIDYITHYQRLSPHIFLPAHPAEAIDPTIGISGLGAASTFPIPAPSSAGSTAAGQPTASFASLPDSEKLFTIYNGSITGLAYLSEGSLTASQSSTRMRISFSAASSTVVLAWGGHIASQYDWGAASSASGISGSPYHTRLVNLDGASIGNQDRSLSAAAVFIPPDCIITGPDPVCPGTSGSYAGPIGTGLSYSWTVSGGATFAGGGTTSTGNPVTVVANPSCGSFTLGLTTTRALDGGTTTCTRTVRVADGAPPSLACPGTATVQCGGDISPSSTGVAVALDSCPVAPVVTFGDVSTPGCGGTRTISRTWTAVDGCGNAAACVQQINVVDTIPPGLTVPPNATVECPGSTATGATGTAAGTDGCGAVGIAYTDSFAAACGSTGTITRRWTATDACGNATTRDQIIAVADTVPPILTVPPPAAVECTGDTSPSATGSGTGSDTCGSTLVSFTDTFAPGCGNTGTITRHWTATDACNRVTTGDQTITVADTTPPTLTAPPPARVECPGDTSPSATGSGTGSDTCGSTLVSFTDTFAPGCGNTGTITRRWTVTDACNRVATGDQIITVADATPPTLTVPPPATVECTDDTTPSATGSGAGTDTCGGTVVSYTDSFTRACGNTGTITRHWLATDDCGITAAGDQAVTIVDTSAPSIACPADAYIDCGGSTDPSSGGAASGTETCGEVSIGYSDSSEPTCGPFTRTWTATDACGNASNCTQLLTIGPGSSEPEPIQDSPNAKLLAKGNITVGVAGVRSLTISGGANANLSARCLPAGLLAEGSATLLPDFGDQTIDTGTCQTTPELPLNGDGSFENVLLRQTIALALNLRRDSEFDLAAAPLAARFCTQATLPGADAMAGTADDVLDLASARLQTEVPSSVVRILGSSATVEDLLLLADTALAGLDTSGLGLSEIAAALDAVNRGFDGNRRLVTCR